MQETRKLRLQAAIQEELSVFVSREVKDPRIPSVTFTEVQVTQDGSHAIVFVAILGADPEDEKGSSLKMKECLTGLNAASGFIRRHLSKILTIRHVPTLAFREDRGFENVSRVHELLQKIKTDPET